MEDALYEIESMHRFAGLRLSDNLPDETTILHFRHLLERHNLGKKLFDEVNRYLKSKGLSMREGSIVNASIISARLRPPRTRPVSVIHRCIKRKRAMNGTLA